MNPFNFPEANLPEVKKPAEWSEQDCQTIAAHMRDATIEEMQHYPPFMAAWFGKVGLPSGEQTAQFTTAWKPTPAELEKLNAGGAIYIGICGFALPPHSITAHNPWEPKPEVE